MRSTSTALFLALASIQSGMAAADLQDTVRFNIAAQSLNQALLQYAEQSGIQITSPSQLLVGKSSDGVIGTFPSGTALEKLLAGTNLRYDIIDSKTVAIHPLASSPIASATRPWDSTLGADNASNEPVEQQGGFRMSQATQEPSTEATSIEIERDHPSQNEVVRLEEVLVTAEKREERLQDVAVSVTVLNPDKLADNGQSRLVDYFATIPGLNLTTGSVGGGTQYLTIRGLSAGYNQNATVATVIDDIPVGASTYFNWGSFTQPDLDPSDLARIEVLKGPQGTLYGADSLGGLVKYVTADPSAAQPSGRIEISGMDIPAGGIGYAVRGAANMPVTDTFAIRTSGFYRRDPGYIDDLTSEKSDFNSVDNYGGHLAALWRPAADFSLKLSALLENSHGAASLVNSNALDQFPQGDLKYTGLPRTSDYNTGTQLYSAVVNYDVAGVSLVSLTGYSTRKIASSLDFTGCCVPYFATPYFPEASATFINQQWITHKFSQELRVSSSVGHWLDWRIGGFYTRETNPDSYQAFNAADIVTGSFLGQTLINRTDISFSEHATFADLVVHISEPFSIEFGGREGWHKQQQGFVQTGPGTENLAGYPPPYVVPTATADESAFTYQVAPKFAISPDLMTYARVATGYRNGGTNYYSNIMLRDAIPTGYAPDKTTNYELGIKGALLDHRLSFDAAAYYIDWSNFQLTVTKPVGQFTASYISNAGNAKSEGLEFSLQARPTRGLTITAQGSFDHAILTQDLPVTSTAYGKAGDRLPYSARFSGGIGVNQDIRLSNDWVGFSGADVNYLGSRLYEFVTAPGPGQSPSARLGFPAYTQVNLHTGVRSGSWRLNVFVNNVSDRRAVIGLQPQAALGVTQGYYATVIQPRTVGLSLSRAF